MNTHVDRTSGSVPEMLDRELNLIREAIAMVASGQSQRIVVASLHFGRELLEPARKIADGQGVRIVPLWTIDDDDSRTGLVVETAGNG